MPRLPTVLFTVCGFITLGYSTSILGLGIWIIAPSLMLIVVGASLRIAELAAIAKAAAMAAGVLTGIFVAAAVAVTIVRGSLEGLARTGPLIAGLAALCVLGLWVGRARPTPPRDNDPLE